MNFHTNQDFQQKHLLQNPSESDPKHHVFYHPVTINENKLFQPF